MSFGAPDILPRFNAAPDARLATMPLPNGSRDDGGGGEGEGDGDGEGDCPCGGEGASKNWSSERESPRSRSGTRPLGADPSCSMGVLRSRNGDSGGTKRGDDEDGCTMK